MPPIDSRRPTHHAWLTELTAIPTASGKEDRVIAWIERWATQRDDLVLKRDPHANLVIEPRMPWARAGQPPIFITAHLDHPAFVVERVLGPSALELAFRGGVMDDYFPQTPIDVHASNGDIIRATITEPVSVSDSPFKHFRATLDKPSSAIQPGDIAAWHLPPPEIIDGLLHTNACDDLAAVAAALAAYDEMRCMFAEGQPLQDVRLLFTLAEEIGFIGAIGACRARTMPEGSRVIALENSRAFDDSPIGAGPIVRVGDRLSIFSPSLTGAIAMRAEAVAGGPAQPTAQQKQSDLPKWRWQRKLMAGGACEATAFTTYGYESTCLCLPLGNYHNMADLAAVQAGTNTRPPRIEREFIALTDFDGLVDLLVACAVELPPSAPIQHRLDRLWSRHAHVLPTA